MAQILEFKMHSARSGYFVILNRPCFCNNFTMYSNGQIGFDAPISKSLENQIRKLIVRTQELQKEIEQ